MTRTGKRRAAVLLALTTDEQSIYQLSKKTGLKYQAVDQIIDSLSRGNLAETGPGGFLRLASGSHLEAALTEARALLAENQEVGA